MKTTVNPQELIELNTCKESLDTFTAAHGNQTVKLSQALELNGWDNFWLYVEAIYSQLTDQQKYDLRVLACDYAKINIEKVRPYCSEENYLLIRTYLNNPTQESRSAAADAADAAWSAAAARSADIGARAAARSIAMEQNTQMLMNVLLKWEEQL